MPEAPFDAQTQLLEILLVEDNLGDARLILETLKDGKIQNRLHVAKDGQKALDYLRRCLGGEAPGLPGLILMDLNLPRMDGWELLQTLKGDPALEGIPVIILTSSESEMDIRRGTELATLSYLTKPLDLEAFMRVVLSVADFGCSLVRLPRGRR